MFALQQLRTTLARNTANLQAARGVAKKAVPPPSESLGQKWAVELIAQEVGVVGGEALFFFPRTTQACPLLALSSPFPCIDGNSSMHSPNLPPPEPRLHFP